MSVFARLPQDMLQYEIARFLNHRDILSFNEVLKNGERVYKKLPVDYAIKHHILVCKGQFDKIAADAQIEINYVEGWGIMGHIERLVVTWLKLFKFFADPINKLAFSYQQGLKESQLRTVHYWLEDAVDEEFYNLIDEQQKKDLLEAAMAAYDAINATPFVRHIKVSREALAIF
jgi:hypothetical protein